MASFPDDSVQAFVDPWWTKAPDPQLRRGSLIWAFAPHVDQNPYRLVATGRRDPTDHSHASFLVEPLRVKDGGAIAPKLPVAALPSFAKESLAIYRAKKRPLLVISTGGEPPSKELRTGTARWQTAATVLAAPYYGVDATGTRGGWTQELVDRIRHCEYPQFIWDILPVGSESTNESILRLDHLQPIGKHPTIYECAGYVLSDQALAMVDEWLTWLVAGLLDQAGDLFEIRKALAEEYGVAAVAPGKK